jgi:hypothetical protein
MGMGWLTQLLVLQTDASPLLLRSFSGEDFQNPLKLRCMAD